VRLPIQQFAGQSVQLRFQVADSQNNDFDAGAAIDNVRIVPTVPEDGMAPVMRDTRASTSFVPITETFTISARFDDSDRGASHIASAEYRINESGYGGNAMRADDGAFDEIDEAVSAQVPRQPIGAHRICVRGADARGNTSAEQCVDVIAYDPTQPYVMGSGWFSSLGGAYVPTYGQGRAQFGFVAQAKSDGRLEGSTRFRLRTTTGQDVEFRSTEYAWLLASGANGRYKGRGVLTVNGAVKGDAAGGSHTVVVAAEDGAVISRTAPDKIRVLITETATGRVVYDNHLMYTSANLSESAAPLTKPDGGGVQVKANTSQTSGGGKKK
jgi:hypothetical protein